MAGKTAEFPQEQRSPTGLNDCRFGSAELLQVHGLRCAVGLDWKRGVNCCGRGTRDDEHEQ